MAEALRKNDFDVKAGLKALFTHPAFYSEKSKFA